MAPFPNPTTKDEHDTEDKQEKEQNPQRLIDGLGNPQQRDEIKQRPEITVITHHIQIITVCPALVFV